MSVWLLETSNDRLKSIQASFPCEGRHLKKVMLHAPLGRFRFDYEYAHEILQLEILIQLYGID